MTTITSHETTSTACSYRIIAGLPACWHPMLSCYDLEDVIVNFACEELQGTTDESYAHSIGDVLTLIALDYDRRGIDSTFLRETRDAHYPPDVDFVGGEWIEQQFRPWTTVPTISIRPPRLTFIPFPGSAATELRMLEFETRYIASLLTPEHSPFHDQMLEFFYPAVEPEAFKKLPTAEDDRKLRFIDWLLF